MYLGYQRVICSGSGQCDLYKVRRNLRFFSKSIQFAKVTLKRITFKLNRDAALSEWRSLVT